MKHAIYILSMVLFCAWGCTSIDSGNSYSGQLHTLSLQAEYPDDYAEYRREGVMVKIEDVDRGYSYTTLTDAMGKADVALTRGIYRIRVSDRTDGNIFNGTAENVRLVDGDVSLSLPLTHSKAGTIIIKEIYCGGVMKTPQEGKYQSDKYIILHNNDSETQYLDGICFGTFDPYNSQGTNVWVTQEPEGNVYPDFAPVVQAIWQFGGDGTSFPLAPGEDAVLVVCGAIDHAAQYPLSVNLNKEGYFVCYNNVYFWNMEFLTYGAQRVKII